MRRLIKGHLGLAATFWGFGVAGWILCVLVFLRSTQFIAQVGSSYGLTSAVAFLAVFLGGYWLFTVIAVLSICRSAARYTGKRVWPLLAKFFPSLQHCLYWFYLSFRGCLFHIILIPEKLCLIYAQQWICLMLASGKPADLFLMELRSHLLKRGFTLYHFVDQEDASSLENGLQTQNLLIILTTGLLTWIPSKFWGRVKSRLITVYKYVQPSIQANNK